MRSTVAGMPAAPAGVHYERARRCRHKTAVPARCDNALMAREGPGLDAASRMKRDFEVLPDENGAERNARRSAHRVVRWSGSHRMPIEAAGVGVVTVLVLALRAPFAMSRLWAEDGSVFLQQASSRGVLRSFGHAYAGYYLFVPRVIGGLASAVPVREAALTTWLGVAAVVGWCAATIYVESKRWLTTRPTRLLLAFSIALQPALGLEAIANSATLQYTLLFTSLVALAGMSNNRWSSVNRVAIVAVTALTTPLALFLAPIAALRVLRSRPRRRPDATVTAWASRRRCKSG